MHSLPNDIAKNSITDKELVLPYEYAIRAIDHLESAGHLVIAWEGWIRYSDDRIGHSVEHQGTVDFHPKAGESHHQVIDRAADFAKQTITEAQARWDEAPEVAGGKLYFCITYNAGKNR